MRKIRTKDIFSALRIIRKADLKEELKPIIKMASEGIKIEDIGIEGVLTIILSVEKAEQGFYDFLAGPFEISPKEVSELELEELKEKIITLEEENDLKNFFTSLYNMITSQR